jgi:hypothetical protein
MGTMHEFPAASENVAVLNGGDGAGSIAVAGGDENRGGAGASHGNSTAVPRVSAWGGRAGSPTEGGSRNALVDEQFPPLPQLPDPLSGGRKPRVQQRPLFEVRKG